MTVVPGWDKKTILLLHIHKMQFFFTLEIHYHVDTVPYFTQPHHKACETVFKKGSFSPKKLIIKRKNLAKSVKNVGLY
jgi:hypothetical protein